MYSECLIHTPSILNRLRSRYEITPAIPHTRYTRYPLYPIPAIPGSHHRPPLPHSLHTIITQGDDAWGMGHGARGTGHGARGMRYGMSAVG